jgi:hypothetical protein
MLDREAGTGQNRHMRAASGWSDPAGVVTLPHGARVRGRRLAVAPVEAAEFTLVLADGPLPPWPYRLIDWPDLSVPTDRDDALAALAEALRRANAGARVEAACPGGLGRTGTALAALAVSDGMAADRAIGWVRTAYHPRAVETPEQVQWVLGLG